MRQKPLKTAHTQKKTENLHNKKDSNNNSVISRSDTKLKSTQNNTCNANSSTGIDSYRSLNNHTNGTYSMSSVSDNKFNSVVKSSAHSKPCLYCDGQNHSMSECYDIKTLPFSSRTDFLKTKGLCWGCLRFGHHRVNCRFKATCSECKGRHPTILHWYQRDNAPVRDSYAEKTTSVPAPTGSSSSSGAGNSQVCAGGSTNVNGDGCTMAIIPVKVKLKNSIKVIMTYAFYDSGSNVSFCTNSLRKRLGCDGRKLKLSLDTMGVPYTMLTNEVFNLEVFDLDMQNAINLPPVYTKESMPVSHEHIPRQNDITKWPHLDGIILPEVSARIDLLIGNNVPDAYSPIEIRTGPRGTPHAVKTLLDWIPWNVIRSGTEVNIQVNTADVYIIQQNEELEKLNLMVQRSISMDFPERDFDGRKENSVEDKRFLEKLTDSCQYKDGHYEFALPFRHNDIRLTNNENQARQRLLCLERKLRKNSKFYDDYLLFMSAVIEQGYAERVPDEELLGEEGRVRYLPHHGVYHPRKPNKIRVVFDCAAKFNGVSLNDLLLPGPNLTSNLVDVLLRFRQDNIAVTSDIESMFH